MAVKKNPKVSLIRRPKMVRPQRVVFEVHGEVLEDGVCVYMGKLGHGDLTEKDFGKTFKSKVDELCERAEAQANEEGNG